MIIMPSRGHRLHKENDLAKSMCWRQEQQILELEQECVCVCVCFVGLMTKHQKLAVA